MRTAKSISERSNENIVCGLFKRLLGMVKYTNRYQGSSAKYDVVCRSLNISANYKDDTFEFLFSKSLDGVDPCNTMFYPMTGNFFQILKI